jgi:hypothetical protein
MPLARAAVLAGLGLAVAAGVAGTAEGRPPPRCGNSYDDECPDERPATPRRPAIEWSTWFRIGFGMQDERADAVPRMTEPPPVTGQDTAWELGLGIEASLGITQRGNLRVGPWIEVRGLREVVAGGEIVLTAVPKKIDMFFYTGQGILAVRGGANLERFTTQVAYGYLAPWKLFDRSPKGAARMMIGVRFVGSYTRSIADPTDWSATIGLETEPFGALRYLLGLRSLY